ncbi:Chemotaxis protein methyltransferase CheR [hydrothermal vent metagenome]|uniref:protein-glutamate O-methyltransferase n=1 Tax=hydrothermal vent metagenome TaxID=652676 RepID=A0A3B1A9F1_9ZZZZ
MGVLSAGNQLALNKRREFVFMEKDFNFIVKLVGERTGIVLSDSKREMVYSRLTRRIRELGIKDFTTYCNMLRDGDPNELVNFTNALTTNLTSFFREPHHFEYLANTVLPAIEANKTNRSLRIWSAGCSSGEEPYTIAMTVREILPENSGWDIKIMATDLDSNMVEKAQTGIYVDERVTGIDKKRLKRWFVKGKGQNVGKVRIKPELQKIITFKQLNLLNDWPMREPMDVIFCRNVVIYFNKDTQKILFSRYSELIADHGHLFIGHSESLNKVSDDFKLIGKTIYQKIS